MPGVKDVQHFLSMDNGGLFWLKNNTLTYFDGVLSTLILTLKDGTFCQSEENLNGIFLFFYILFSVYCQMLHAQGLTMLIIFKHEKELGTTLSPYSVK